MFETDAVSAVWGISPMMLIVGSVYHVISIATPHWLANGTVHCGLWDFCLMEGGCISITEELNSNDHSWYRAVQGLEIAVTMLVLVSLVTGLMRINLGHRIWQTASGITALLAGVVGVCGAIVYGQNSVSLPALTLSWSYVFNAASCCMCLLSGPVLLLDSVLHR